MLEISCRCRGVLDGRDDIIQAIQNRDREQIAEGAPSYDDGVPMGELIVDVRVIRAIGRQVEHDIAIAARSTLVGAAKVHGDLIESRRRWDLSIDGFQWYECATMLKVSRPIAIRLHTYRIQEHSIQGRLIFS